MQPIIIDNHVVLLYRFIEFNSYNLTGLCNIDKWKEEELSQDSFVTKYVCYCDDPSCTFDDFVGVVLIPTLVLLCNRYSQSLPVIITMKHTQQVR